jgi:translation initiation factor IF-3
VKALVQFRGREIAHTDLGRKLLLRFAEDLVGFGAIDGMPRLEGRSFHVLISPVKTAVKADKPPSPPKPATAAPTIAPSATSAAALPETPPPAEG